MVQYYGLGYINCDSGVLNIYPQFWFSSGLINQIEIPFRISGKPATNRDFVSEAFSKYIVDIMYNLCLCGSHVWNSYSKIVLEFPRFG